MKRTYLLTGLVCFITFVSVSSEVKNPGGERVISYTKAIHDSRKCIERAMKQTGTIGMVVTVVDSSRVVYSEGFGYADVGSKLPVSDSTIFRTGSMGKLFTAVGIMKLVERGAVCLDSPITTYLPEFKIKSRFEARQITVRDLLIHESGLPSDIYNNKIFGQRVIPGIDTIYRTVVEQCANEYVTNPPRTAWSYSNIGYTLLGCIIERASKCSYAAFVQNSIFAPLGMKHSAVGIETVRNNPLFSNGYFSNSKVEPFSLSRDIPAGDIVVSVADLSRFIKMLFSGGDLEGKHILERGTIEQMWTQQNGDIPLDFRKQGLCFFLNNFFGSTLTMIPEKIASHGGDVPPFHTYMMLIPEEKIGVVIMINCEQGSSIPAEIGGEILENFYQAKKCSKIPEQHYKAGPTVKLSAQKLQELTGYYVATTTAGYVGTANIQLKGRDLCFDFFGTYVSLLPHSDSTFSLRYKLFGLVPIPLKTIRNLRLEVHKIGNRQVAALLYQKFYIGMIADKVVFDPPPKEWLARLGTYSITNGECYVFTDSISEKYYIAKQVELSYDSTLGTINIDGHPLKFLSSTDAVTLGIGRCTGETVRAYNVDGVEYLWYSGYSLLRIKK